MKKRSETQALQCALAAVRRSQKLSPRRSTPPSPIRRKNSVLAAVRRRQKFRPTTDPLPWGAGQPKFNQLEMVTTFTYKPSLVKIDARNVELSW